MAATSRQPECTEQLFRTCISKSQLRLELWVEFIQSAGVQRMAEIGVYRGDFATDVLRRCQGLTAYYMIDPWGRLNDWNKPANHDDAVLEEFFRETKARTDFAAAKRVILRGKTTEVIEQIADGELDFAYIDADHTLKGIAIDLIRVYPKVRTGGFLGGGAQFAFVDLTGKYDDVGLRSQFVPGKLLKITMGERFPRLMRVARKTRDLFLR